MNREDIIRMAREAGLKHGQHWDKTAMDSVHVFRFATLVAAAEREACAMEAEYEAARWPYAPECREPCEDIAKAIRARKEKA